MVVRIEDPNEYDLKGMLWSGAEKALEEIIDADYFDEFCAYIDDVYGDEGIELTQLNDILRFDFEQLKKDIGMFDLEDEVDVKALKKWRDDLKGWEKARMITDSDMIGYGEESESDLSDNIEKITSRIANVIDCIDEVLDATDMEELEETKDSLESEYETLTDGLDEYVDDSSKVYKELSDHNVGDFFYNL